MSERIRPEGLENAVMDCLEDYSKVLTDGLKKSVKDAAKTVKDEISANAPRLTGKYAASWTTKVTKQSTYEMEVTVHSKNRYQIAHLLENGHAMRNGGRVAARVHIAPAEEKGIEQLEKEVERMIQNG